jgi:hypothetical protein
VVSKIFDSARLGSGAFSACFLCLLSEIAPRTLGDILNKPGRMPEGEKRILTYAGWHKKLYSKEEMVVRLAFGQKWARKKLSPCL